MKYTEKPIGPKKKMVKPAKKVAQRKYNAANEKYQDAVNIKDNAKAKKPADIADALNKAKQGYSKKPRVKPSKKV